MEKNPFVGREVIEVEFLSIITPLITRDLLRPKDLKLLRTTLTSAAQYLESEASEIQLAQAKDALAGFVYDIKVHGPVTHSFEAGPSTISHQIFLESYDRFLPCPPFCK